MMSFWSFLDWLWAAIDKVLDWFGTSFWTLRNNAANAWNWAVSLAATALRDAQSFAADQVNKALASLQVAKEWLKGLIDAVYNWAAPKIQAAEDFAAALVNGARNEANNLIASARASIESFAAGLVQGAKTIAADALKAATDALHSAFDPLLPVKGALPNILTLTATDVMNKLITFVTSMFSTLLIFVQNPVGFITNLLFPYLVEVISFAVGYGLGAVETQLPPIPVWGTGGVIIPPGDIVIPPGTPALVKPLDNLWISGYTFTPPTHYGVDYGLAAGTAVKAAHNGVVMESGYSNVGYGITVLLQSSVYTTRYGHFQSTTVVAGQQVQAGQIIGYGDSTGNSTGNHLHFELKINGAFVNPVLYL